MKPSQPTPVRSPQLTQLNHPPPSSALAPQPNVSELPRERLLERGAQALSPVELLAVILNTGRGRACDVMSLAHELLHTLGGVGRLCRASAEELTQVKGIGPVKAARLIAGFELARRGTPQVSLSARDSTSLELIRRAKAYAPQADDEGEVTLIAYPSETDLKQPGRVITLSLDQSLAAMVGEPADRRLSHSWLRRLLSHEPEQWSLVAIFHHPTSLTSPSLEEEQRALELLFEQAQVIGLSVDRYLLVQGERYAQLTPRRLLEGGES